MNGSAGTPEPREVDIGESASVRGAGIDGSVGSDTDTSKNEAAGIAGKDPDPKYSVKKSATFKPVSVTKNLLAKTSSVSTPTKVNAEKGTSTLVDRADRISYPDCIPVQIASLSSLLR